MQRVFSPLELLADRLRASPAADREIFSAVVAACTRLQALRTSGKAGRFDELVANGAWTESAFALIALEMPAWSVRRLVYDDGEWLCSLSQQPNLPLEIDDTVDARHAALPLAILGALVEAKSRKEPAPQSDFQRRPQLGSEITYAQCCDNFA